MLFNSLQYALFLPVVLLLYYCCWGQARLWVLLIASYLFYASWNWIYLFLIAGLSLINFCLGLGLSASNQRGKSTQGAWLITLGIAVNLGVLCYFKYAAFFLVNFSVLFSVFGFHLDAPEFTPVLPLAISFFCFEFIHYLVDVWKGNLAILSPLKFAIFAAFFPTQIAGPIKRYEQFVPQLDNPSRFDWDRVAQGLRLIVEGLFKKVVLADNLAHWVNTGFQAVSPDKPSLATQEAWLIVLGFAMQIYFDFSGYTDMGRGSALMLGFEVPENFRRPYLSISISEFWRRWHISLSSWLRDYVYIPLGGNRRARDRNLFVTLVLGGLWHGTNWTFVIWGAAHGLLLVINQRVSLFLPNPMGLWRPVSAMVGWFITFTLVCIGWVFFRANSVDQAFRLLGMLFSQHAGAAYVLETFEHFLILGIVLSYFGIALIQENLYRLPIDLGSFCGTQNRWLALIHQSLVPAAYTLLFAAILLFRPAESIRFIYFQF